MIVPDSNDAARERVNRCAAKSGPRDRCGRTKLAAHKIRASDLVNMRIITWHLERPPCEGCGSVADVQGHHSDYSKPYEVDWLCRLCHGAEHRGALIKTGPKADPNILLCEPVKQCKLCECDCPITDRPGLKVFMCSDCTAKFKRCCTCTEILLLNNFSRNQGRCRPCKKLAYETAKVA